MKTNRHLLIFCLGLITFFSVNAQKANSSLKITFDCVKADNSISVSDLANCKKLSLSGKGSENFKIITAIISIKILDKTNEFMINGDAFSQELIAAVSKLSVGDIILVENAKFQSIKDEKVIKNLPSSTLLVK